MSLGACNCCEEPPCATPVLEFISVSASCTVCGYALPVLVEGVEADPEADPPVAGVDPIPSAADQCLRFSKRSDTYAYDQSYSGPYEPSPGMFRDYENHSSQTDIREMFVNAEGVCSTRYVSGTYSFSESIVQGPIGESADFDVDYVENASAGSSGVYSGTWTYTDNLDSEGSDSGASGSIAPLPQSTIDETWDYESPGVYTLTTESGGITFTSTITFSEPVTACEPELPAWPAWQGESEDDLLPGQGYEDSALRSAGGTCGLTLTLRSVKWRVKHQPSGTCYLKAWIRKTFTPAATVPPTDPLPAPTVTNTTYEWTGTGNPCLADPALAVDHADNLIHGSATEETAPETAGVVTWEIVKFSCVAGYEPDISDPENPQPNGFPDPTWEAAPP